MELTPEERRRINDEEKDKIESKQSAEWKLRFQRMRAFLIAYPLVLPLLLIPGVIVLAIALDAIHNSSNTNTQSSGNYNYQYYTPQPQPSTTTNRASSTSLTSTRPIPTPSKSENDEVRLHIDGVTKIPVAITQDAFYELEDAIGNDEDEKALKMIHQKGKVFMVENDSTVIVIEPFGYLTRVKLKKGGRSGWVKSSWLR